MLSKDMYTEEYIMALHKQTGNDPALLERVIYAFGLLEAIKSVGLPFCFKGGTSLMLILDHPMRLSTDIDIIVKPGIDIENYIKKAGEIFPFTAVEERVRIGKNNIEKRHFHFKYRSPKTGRDLSILLDVLFENIQYSSTMERPIKNELLLTNGDDLSVIVPNVNGVLGDKLTAFAPHTTGIPFGEEKELEIIKQLFDCGTLFDAMDNFEEVCATYKKIVKTEADYRGISITYEDVLKDTIKASLCIASRGQLYTEEYTYYKDGIFRIRNHALGGKFSGNIAVIYASKVLYLVSSMLVGSTSLTKITDATDYLNKNIELQKPKRFSYLRIVDPIAYGYIIEASKLLQGTEFEKL